MESCESHRTHHHWRRPPCTVLRIRTVHRLEVATTRGPSHTNESVDIPQPGAVDNPDRAPVWLFLPVGFERFDVSPPCSRGTFFPMSPLQF